MTPELSLCIVNHRTPGLLADCLRSIADTRAGWPIEILIVNNTPDDAEQIRVLAARYGPAQVIQNPAPLGYAANQNQMFRRATGRYWLALNSDTRVQPGALQALSAFMDLHPRAALAGPRLVRADGRLQPSARDFPTPLTHFLEASGLWRLLRGRRSIGAYYALCSPHTEVRRVDWLTGACLIVRPAAVAEAGGFDEALFPEMYGEDLEWAWRLRAAGWEVWFDPHAVVTHLENQSPLEARSLAMYRGFYRFCAAHYPPGRQAAIRAATAAALWPRRWLARDRQAQAAYAALIQLPMPSAAELRRPA